MIEACSTERRSCSYTITGPYTQSLPRSCGRIAQWRVDGIALCTQHAQPLLEGRAAEVAEAHQYDVERRAAARVRRLTEGLQGLIYVLQPYGVTPAPLKIGFSRDLESFDLRLNEHQQSNWHRLEVVDLRRGTLRIEKDTHRQLRAHRIRGEWFWPHSDVMRVFYACTEPLVEEGVA